MSFFFDYLQGRWAQQASGYDKADLQNWSQFLKDAEQERQRDRIIAWKDKVHNDDFAVNANESEYYRRTAGFIWRYKDETGVNKARNHQYLYNLEVYGHRQPTRRDKSELEAAQAAVAAKVASGALGPLSPLE